jgi:hypothetical protein
MARGEFNYVLSVLGWGGGFRSSAFSVIGQVCTCFTRVEVALFVNVKSDIAFSKSIESSTVIPARLLVHGCTIDFTVVRTLGDCVFV